MKHPNEGFLRKFLSTDKEYHEQQRLIARKKQISEYFENKEKNKTVLLEQDKKSINTVIEKVYKKTKKQNLVEQNLNLKDWKMTYTEHGIFYFNEKENLWMNNFGVIKPSIKDFTEIFDYDVIATGKPKEEIPEPPEDIQVTNINEGFFTLSFIDDTTNENKYVVYVSEGKGT